VTEPKVGIRPSKYAVVVKEKIIMLEIGHFMFFIGKGRM